MVVVDTQTFKAGMRRLASGIALVTTRHEETNYGLAATSVSALTAEPPTLLVCINRSASCHDAITASGRFCVNILSSEHADLLAVFSTSCRRDDRFAGGDWTASATAPPRLSTALATFDCRVARAVEQGTHSIVIGRIQDVTLHQQAPALVYYEGSACLLPGPT